MTAIIKPLSRVDWTESALTTADPSRCLLTPLERCAANTTFCFELVVSVHKKVNTLDIFYVHLLFQNTGRNKAEEP